MRDIAAVASPVRKVLLSRLTATLTATPADAGAPTDGSWWGLRRLCVLWSVGDWCGHRRVVGIVSIAEDVSELVDGVVLEAQADVGVDLGGDADVGVAE